MVKYKIDYIDKDDDLCHIWVYAENEDEAIYEAHSEQWDIKNIIQITKG